MRRARSQSGEFDTADYLGVRFFPEGFIVTDLSKVFESEKIKNLTLGAPLVVQRASTISEVLKKMQGERLTYAVVAENRRVVGIFTERDMMTRAVEQRPPETTPIEKLMTPNPSVLKDEDSVAEAIRIMNRGGYRHVPIVNSEGELLGVLGVRDLIRYLADHYPYEVYNLPPDPRQIIREAEGA